ncbi:MAG: hypothetical protein U1E57_04305 [Paenacidovorax caeni]
MFLAIGKAKDGSNKLALLERLLPVYAELFDTLAGQGVEWVQIDEPILVTELMLIGSTPSIPPTTTSRR